MSNSTATEAEWQANYQNSDQAREDRRSGSGRHRNHHRSPHHQPQQPGGGGQASHRSHSQHQQYYQQQAQLQQQQQPQQHHQQQQHQQQRSSKHQQAPQQQPRAHHAAPRHSASGVTGEYRSGHIEVDSLYGGQSGQQLQVNSMNAPNNSTMQCGCENIDCPFCNQMMSIQMSS